MSDKQILIKKCECGYSVTVNQNGKFLKGQYARPDTENIAENVLYDSAEYIQTLEAKIKELEFEREWVSVEDRLPEINGDYLCYVTFKGDYGYTEDEIKTTICSYIRFGKQWSLVGASGRYFKGIKVHKWMPLPKSPKGE